MAVDRKAAAAAVVLMVAAVLVAAPLVMLMEAQVEMVEMVEMVGAVHGAQVVLLPFMLMEVQGISIIQIL